MNTNASRIATLSLAAALGLLLPSLGWTQGPPPPGANGMPSGQGGQAGGQTMSRSIDASRPTATVQVATVTITLLGMTTVQRDLAITADQYTALSNLAARAQGTNMSEDAVRAAAGAILTTAQATRLTELLVQYMGYGALSFADVRAKLGLSADQETRIGEILSGLAVAKRAVATTTTNAAALARATTELQTNANAALAKVLTEAQDATLRAQAGRPIGS